MKDENNSRPDAPGGRANANILIGKFLSGEAKPDEAIELDQLLKDPAMQLEYEKMLEIWKELPASPDTTLPDIKNEWQNLQSGLKPVNGISNIYKYLLVVSTAAVVLISSYFLIFKSAKTGDSKVGTAIQTDTFIQIADEAKTVVLNSEFDIDRITGTFDFKDVPLTEAVKQLEKTFNVRIELDKTKFSECNITAVFSNKSLAYILDIINITFNTTHSAKGHTIIINGKGCN